MKKLRNLIIAIGVMAALLPTFLYYTNHTYYGAAFSMATACTAVSCFIAADACQFFEYKKKGYPTLGPLAVGTGFIILLIYLLFFFH